MELLGRERVLRNIEIQHIEEDSGSHGQCILTWESGSLNNKNTIAYSKHALRTIGRHVQHDQRLRMLPFRLISTVRSLRINHKPQKNRTKRTEIKQTSSNSTNLINIKKINLTRNGNLTIGTCNIQSVPRKELQVSDLISDYSLDLLVLTETWLTSNHSFWKDTAALNKDHLKLHTADRQQGRGGGLALVTNKNLAVRQLDAGTKWAFKFAHWSITSRNTNINIHGIYHPPYSLTNKITNQMFIDDFTEYVSTSLPDHSNNIYIGDFNLHVSDSQDTDAAIFNDSIEAMGLYQHIHFQTHKSGNVLDLLLSDITQVAGVITVAPGP